MTENEQFVDELSEVESPKESKRKLTCNELFNKVTELTTQLEELENDFLEKEKQFDKDRKEYNNMRKKLRREFAQTLKKCSKKLESELSKSKKRKRSGGGKAGFNKPVKVTEKLRVYMKLEAGAMKTRPEVTKLLNTCLKADDCRDGKTVIIKKKKVAKALGCKKGRRIEFGEFQTFIKGFYDEEKNQEQVVDI